MRTTRVPVHLISSLSQFVAGKLFVRDGSYAHLVRGGALCAGNIQECWQHFEIDGRFSEIMELVIGLEKNQESIKLVLIREHSVNTSEQSQSV